jgi:hypothetical protein
LLLLLDCPLQIFLHPPAFSLILGDNLFSVLLRSKLFTAEFPFPFTTFSATVSKATSKSKIAAFFIRFTACIKCKLGHWEHPNSKRPKLKKYEGLIVHDLRRSAIRNMTLAGVPQNVIMAISGHKTIAVFLRYNIVAPKQLHTAMQAVELQQRAELQGQDPKSQRKALKRKEPKRLQGGD